MDTLSKLALCLTPGLGPTTVRRLVESFPDKDIFDLPAKELVAAFGGHRDIVHNIVSRSAFARAAQELEFCQKNGIRVLFFTDKDYPQRLNNPETADCPALLFVLGETDLNASRTVGIVGTRHATAQGRETTARLVSQLVPLNTPIISGLAYGIDTASHAAAVDNGLPTVAVLGHGLDRIYPAQNRPLASRLIRAGGALVTEYPSGTAINPRFFPARNRIIAALSDAVVVVESSEKGGSLITATIAAGYHREVFAVPGRLTDTYAKGTNNMIATNKALLVRDADDIAYQMGWPLSRPQNAAANQQTLFPTLNAEAQNIIERLRQKGPMGLAELALDCDKPIAQMASLLFNLELQEAVRVLPGQVYESRI